MVRYWLGAGRQALRTLRSFPTVVGHLSQLSTLAHPVQPLFRLMSNANSSQPSHDSEQSTTVPATVAASVASPSPASLQSLLTVCVDGLCSRRLRWDELVVLISAGRLEALGRLDWQLSDYAKSKAVMLEEYHSVTDRLRDRRLAAPCRLEDGRKRCDWTQQSSQQIESPPADHPMRVELDDDGLPLRLCWWHNEFGYAIDDHIGHDLVWTDRYLSPHSRLFQRVLDEHKPSKQFDVLTFINPPHLRSIPDLHHIHVFSRPRQKQQQTSSTLQNAAPVTAGNSVDGHG